MAELKARLRSDLTEAMKAQDKLRVATLRMLLSRKADADRADYDRWTPLMYAVRNGDLACADILLEGGASVTGRHLTFG